MVSAIGKILRKIRIDWNESLATMAAKFDLSPSYLSAIENGKRSLPPGIYKKLQALYGVTDDVLFQLMIADVNSYPNVGIELIGQINEVMTTMAMAEIKKPKNVDYEKMRDQILMKRGEMLSEFVFKAVDVEWNKWNEKGGKRE